MTESIRAVEQEIDARGLEPPEPLMLVLDALATLPKNACLRLLIHREPLPLYSLLQMEGWHYVTHPLGESEFEILITRSRLT